MTWNYRIIRKTKRIKGKIIRLYDIHEVYYDKGKLSWTKEPVTPNGMESLRDLRVSLSMMLADALKHPIMEIHKGKLIGQKEGILWMGRSQGSGVTAARRSPKPQE